ncbi:stage II sporulation protein D [Amphibacillus marinus]|uniref:Stage II sporulation protein D n=1 Tax=Amphibacillus marinus TaxID=872970 RepID=A0A1H8N2X8_9BACI|nr:stage II sporulation protein D [Amphibacillus marinus]SEO23869.1 stage II sporulation protein D [Amphibacillus marinus]
MIQQRSILKPILIVVISMVVITLGIPSTIVLLSSDSHSEEEAPAVLANVQTELPEESMLTVKVERASSNEIEAVPLEQYVISVVSSEMPADFELEALKAQALAARTYIVQYMLATDAANGEQVITDTVQHQVYRNQEELKELWGSDYSWKLAKITEAVAATAGEILTYDNNPITPAFFSTSNGKTENSEDYWENSLPYLVTVDSHWDADSPKFIDQKTIQISEVEQQLGISFTSPVQNPRMTYTSSNRVQTVELGGNVFTGREIREKLDLRSTDFTIEHKNDYLIFTTKGFGHGVGMSQYGANGMAKEGKGYQEIVQHYYQGVEISAITEAATTLVAKN